MDKNNRKAIAIGDFDGMHLAHKTVCTGADNAIIYCVNNKFTLLQKDLFTERYPNVIFANFEEIKGLSGEEFIEDILIKKFDIGIVLCGFNFRFGKNASWSALDMRKYLEDKDIWVRILEAQDFEEKPISSTRIRKALENGRIEAANEMLGYNFTYRSKVVEGDKRGRKIGFPTINQHLPEGLIVPKFGVYESRTIIDGKVFSSFTNIGIRPTWKVDKPLSETHIFNFDGELYNKDISIELVRYIRPEKTFDNLNELKEQLINDKSSII